MPSTDLPGHPLIPRESPSGDGAPAGGTIRAMSRPGMLEENSLSPASAGPSAKLRMAGKKVQAINAMSKNTIISHETLFKLDAYALDVEPPSTMGGLVSAVVILLTLAYSCFLIYQFITRPLLISNQIEWFQDMGPFPMNVTCHTTSGCYISNYVNNSWTQAKVDAQQHECTFLAYRDIFTATMSYTMWPKDGLVVMYKANDTSESMPPGYGYTTTSQANCKPGMCMQGFVPMNAPVAPGVSLASYVRVQNNTRNDLGRLRHEWFIVQVDAQTDQVDPGMPCAETASAAHSQGLVQSRIDLQPSYNVITVTRDNSWLGLWGTFGGAYELFLEFGGIFLASAGLLSLLERLWCRITGSPIRKQDTEDGLTGTVDRKSNDEFDICDNEAA